MAISEPGSPPTGSDRTVCTIVFGSSTLVGRALVDSLTKSSLWTVRIADTLPPPSEPAGSDHLSAAASADYHRFDFSDLSALRSAVDGSAVVFLIDPLPWPAAADEDFLRLHALAAVVTRNLIAACRESGVQRLVYSGSTSVVTDRKTDIRDVDESLPYPHKYQDAYNELRMQVEIMVLSANGKCGLLTCALRPSNVFGPRDPNFVPFLLREARVGRAKFIVGDGRNRCDFTYVANVVHALASAEHALRSELASVAGKPFFVTNDDPVEFWEFVGVMLEGLGHQRPYIRIPTKLALFIVFMAELVSKKLGFSVTNISPAVLYSLLCTRTFSCSKAKALLGYSPTVTMEDGIALTLSSLAQLAKEQNYFQDRDLTISSKAEKLLGSGVVANMLLWRDERRTFACLIVLYVLFYWFVLCATSLISSSAEFLMVVAIALYIHGKLPSSIFGMKIGKMSSSSFDVSETIVRDTVFALAFLWNKGVSTIKMLGKGKDFSTFLKTACLLYIFKMLSTTPIEVLIGLGLALLFIVFIVYEQCEEEVDNIGAVVSAAFIKLREHLIAKYPAILGHQQDFNHRMEMKNQVL